MNLQTALKIVSRGAPCPHESWESLGAGNWGKCYNCGATFVPDNQPKHQKAFDDFGEAMDVIEKAISAGVPNL